MCLAAVAMAQAVLFANVGLALVLAPVVIVGLVVASRRRPGRATSRLTVHSIPTYVGAATIVVYAVVLTVVHNDVALRRVKTRDAAYLSAQAAINREAAPVSHEIKELTHRLIALEPTLRSTNRAVAGRARRRADVLNREDNQANAKAEVLLRRFLRLGPLPPPDYLAVPAWFTKLGSFFPLAAQILSALMIAIAVVPRFLAGQNETLRSAMLWAILGVGAALFGSLPAVRPGVDAFVFGFVLSGMTTGVAVLGVLLLTEPTPQGLRRRSGIAQK